MCDHSGAIGTFPSRPDSGEFSTTDALAGYPMGTPVARRAEAALLRDIRENGSAKLDPDDSLSVWSRINRLKVRESVEMPLTFTTCTAGNMCFADQHGEISVRAASDRSRGHDPRGVLVFTRRLAACPTYVPAMLTAAYRPAAVRSPCCPGHEMDYAAAYPADRSINIVAWPGGYCCANCLQDFTVEHPQGRGNGNKKPARHSC